MSIDQDAAGAPAGSDVVDLFADEQPAPAPDPAPDPGGQDTDTEDPELAFPDVYAFVREYLSKAYARQVSAQGRWHWCSQWWNHPEAVSRLQQLWLGWEAARQAAPPAGIFWWTQQADPTMNALSSEDGTFSRCAADRHYAVEPLPGADGPTGFDALADALAAEQPTDELTDEPSEAPTGATSPEGTFR